MGINIGLDIGAISLKLAALGKPADRATLESVCAAHTEFRLISLGDRPLLLSDYRRISGSPIQSTYDLLRELYEIIPEDRVEGMRVTGSGSRTIAKVLGLFFENEFKAIARMIGTWYPQVRTVFELGGESSKYIRLENGGIQDYDRSGECAAGTGSFLDQQALRMQYSVEEVGDLVCGAGCAARIAGRCSVFAKSDMIHAQQKGYSPAEILRGLCDAVARNFKSSVVKGRPVEATVALIGAVSQNAGVVGALREAFSLTPEQLFVPEEYAWCGAIGTAILEAEEPRKRSILDVHRLRQHDVEESVQDTKPLSTENVVQLRDRVPVYVPPSHGEPIPAYLGLDIGSVSTNVVVIDEFGTVIHDVYLRTAGRPIEAVQQGLAEVERKWGSRLKVCGVGTTGSGRELIAEFVGADVVNDEITAHKTGAIHISRTLGGEPVDTIFEIGGQDSKFISIENGVVVDFAMNEACAAGTGSFLEEQAEKLGISIKGEFARLALSAQSPTRLGERCTVFMERDVTGWMHKGETVPHLVAGLAYSIALNYLNRVVRGRKIGKVIYFQGGHGVQRRGDGGVRQPAGQEDHGAAVQRRDGCDRDGADRAAMARGDAGREPLPRLRPAQAGTDHARFRVQGVQQSLRHEGIRDRGAEELLGRQVLRQVPQAFHHGPEAGDRRPVRLSRGVAGSAAHGGGRQVQDRPAARHVDAGPAAVLEALFRRTGAGDGALAGDGSADFGGRHRTLGGRALLSGAGGARACAGADEGGRGLRVAAGDGGCGGGRRRLRVALLPVEPDAAVGAEIGAGAGGACGDVPHADAAFPPGTGADQESPGRDHAAAGRDAAGERPRGGRRLHGAAQVSANA